MGYFEVITNSVQQTIEAGEKLAANLKPPVTVALNGELGAGKTAFCQGIMRGLGYKDHITSPTYSIVNVYDLGYPVYHFDLYRISSEDELWNIGIDDYIGDKNAISIVEWFSNFGDEFFTHVITVDISKIEGEDTKRQIRIGGVKP